MEKWDELEGILTDNELRKLLDSIQKQENYEMNIKKAIDEAIQEWTLTN